MDSPRNPLADPGQREKGKFKSQNLIQTFCQQHFIKRMGQLNT